MGKRSTFERRAGDAYPTPIEAVLPLSRTCGACATSPSPARAMARLYAISSPRPVLHLCRRYRDRTGRACP